MFIGIKYFCRRACYMKDYERKGSTVFLKLDASVIMSMCSSRLNTEAPKFFSSKLDFSYFGQFYQHF
jgi:hypothetical protein